MSIARTFWADIAMMVRRAQSTAELSLLFGGTPLRAKEKVLFGNGFKNGAMIATSMLLSLAASCWPFILWSRSAFRSKNLSLEEKMISIQWPIASFYRRMERKMKRNQTNIGFFKHSMSKDIKSNKYLLGKPTPFRSRLKTLDLAQLK